MHITVINPGNRKQVYQSLGSSLAAIEPPVWAGMMASYVRGQGLEVSVLDANALGLSPEETAQEIKNINPTLAVVCIYGHQPSASTQNMPAAGATCAAIKQLEPDRPVLMVGGHVASLPERTLREEACDYAATGEGLHTMVDLVRAIEAGNGKGPADITKVRGLAWLEDDKLRSNHGGALLRTLDEDMPGLAWDLLPMDRYRAHNWHCFDGLQREPYASVYTTLGCPYHCTFCCIQAPFKMGEKEEGMKETVNSYRLWSVDAVMAQIDLLVNEYGVKNIKFADELFVLNPKHVEGICDKIIERGYDLNIWAYARVDSLKDRFLEKLKRAGITWLALGIEAANSRVRDDINKNFEAEHLIKIMEKVEQFDLYVIGNYIFGLPEDDHESMQETLDLSMELNCEFANFYCSMAYPGSQLYRDALKNNFELPATWSGYSQHSYDSLPLRTKHITSGEVLKFRDDAFQTYFNNPHYLAKVERKFGAETVEHIKQMSGHKLDRKFVAGGAR